MNYLHQVPEYILLGLTRGSMYALIALGYTLVYGVLQLLNFAHSEVFMSGTFGSFIVVHAVVGDGQNTAHWMVPVVILIGMLSGALTGACVAWVLERVAYRPLRRRGAPKLAFLISAIGASFFLSQLAGKMFNRFNGNAFPVYFDQNHVLLRISTALSYLPQGRPRPNLTVRPDARVDRVVFEGKRAVGVERPEGGDRSTRREPRVLR